MIGNDGVKKAPLAKRKQKKYAGAYHDSEYILAGEDGRPFRPDCVHRSFQRVLKRNTSTPLVTFYDLSHTTASMLYAYG